MASPPSAVIASGLPQEASGGCNKKAESASRAALALWPVGRFILILTMSDPLPIPTPTAVKRGDRISGRGAAP